MGAVLAWHHRSIVAGMLLLPSLVLLWQTLSRRQPPIRLVPPDAAWLVPVKSAGSTTGVHTVDRRYPDEDPARSWDPQWWAASNTAVDASSLGDIGTPREHFNAFVAARAREGRTAANCQCDSTSTGGRHKAWEDRSVGCDGDPPELRGDSALIESYANNRRTLCKPQALPSAQQEQASSVTCSFHHSMFTQKNRSASICELSRVVVRMDLTLGELMTDYSSPATPLVLDRGAVAARCDPMAGAGGHDDSKRFIGPQFSWLSQLLQNAKTTESMVLSCDHTVNHTVILLSRDNNLNLFHSAEDFLQVYIAFVVLDLDPRSVEVLISDLVRNLVYPHQKIMLPGPYLSVWSRVFSRRGVNNLALMREAIAGLPSQIHGPKICFERLVLPPPGIGSLICQHVGASSACGDVALVQAAADYMVRALGVGSISSTADHSTKGKDQHRTRRPVLTLIQRKDYAANVVGGTAGRLTHGQISNLDEVLSVLHYEYADRLKLQIVDFAVLSFQEQVEIGHGTDILLGAHGAGLTHMLWMKPGSSVVEISTRNMAGYMRMDYNRVEGQMLRESGEVKLERLRVALDGALRNVGVQS